MYAIRSYYALQDGKLSPPEIDEVIFVGGSTRIPAIAKAVEGFMGKKALQNINSYNFV